MTALATWRPRHAPRSRLARATLFSSLLVGGWYGFAASADGSTPQASLSAAVVLVPQASIVDQPVAVTLAHAHVPSGVNLSGIVLDWGDGTRPAHPGALDARLVHRYLRPGRYHVTATLVAGRKASGGPAVSAHASAVEVVTAPSGSYTGSDRSYAYVDPVRFYVARGRTTMQDILIPKVNMRCTPGGGNYGEQLTIPSAAIGPNGSFAVSTVVHGVVHESGGNFPSVYKMSFKGTFNGVNPSGEAEAGGTFEETMRFSDSAARSCTSGPQPFQAMRDRQPSQTAASPAVGSYTGSDPEYSYVDLVTFYVAANGRELRNILVPSVPIYCVPGTDSLSDLIVIPSAAVTHSGAFTARAVQHGTHKGYAATFTYLVAGHFHGLDPSGAPRASGTFLETVTFSDTARRACTSETQPWSALRDPQPSQTATVRPGNYRGADPEYSYVDPVTFSVANGKVEHVAISRVPMTCAPGGKSAASSFSLPAVAIRRDGSFAGKAAATGVYNGVTARFAYLFGGSFESLDKNGVPRVSGTYRETMSYSSSGSSYSCTSNDQPWSARLTSG